MADIVVSGFSGSARSHPHSSTLRRLKAFWRFQRVRQAHRMILRQLLAETSDARILEDVGLSPPHRGALENWALVVLFQER